MTAQTRCLRAAMVLVMIAALAIVTEQASLRTRTESMTAMGLRYRCRVCHRAISKWRATPAWGKAAVDEFEVDESVCPPPMVSIASERTKRCLVYSNGACQVWDIPDPEVNDEDFGGTAGGVGGLSNPYDGAYEVSGSSVSFLQLSPTKPSKRPPSVRTKHSID